MVPAAVRCSCVGYNHSGKEKVINFLSGPMGFANAQRMINYIRIFTEFITQPEYVNVIPMFGIVNEPVIPNIGIDTLTSLCVAILRLYRARLTHNHQQSGGLPDHPCDHGYR